MSEAAAWFLYSIVVAILLGLAAAAAESALRGSGRSGRWAWAGGMVASVALPVLAWLGLGLRSVAVVPESALIPLAPLVAPVAAVGGVAGAGPAGPSVDQILMVMWVVVTGVVLVYMALSWAAIVRDRRHWRHASMGGIRVAVTPDTGPAAWGVRHPEILLPEWVTELESRVRRLMLLHEGEHVRAGDTRVVLAGLLLLAAAPWNIPLWWQFRRLRQAIELDCDARVLKRAPDARRYGSLLLEVGRRRTAPVMVVALADPPSFLERRIRLITARATVRSMRRVGGLALIASSLVAIAICTRDPMAAQSLPVEIAAVMRAPVVEAAPARTVALETASPEPDPMAAEAVMGASAGASDASAGAGSSEGAPSTLDLNTANPAGPELSAIDDERVDTDAGRSAGAIDVRTRTERMRMAPDGAPEASLAQATTLSAAPATVSAKRPSIETTTEHRADQVVSPGPSGESQQPPAADRVEGSDITAEPRLENVAEIQTLIEREYPPLLRDAGIGGVANVWFLIAEDGSIERTQLAEGAGHPKLDEAALRVAAAARFSPALSRGVARSAWVSQPISFVSR
jgi:TonB family protein